MSDPPSPKDPRARRRRRSGGARCRRHRRRGETLGAPAPAAASPPIGASLGIVSRHRRRGRADGRFHCARCPSSRSTTTRRTARTPSRWAHRPFGALLFLPDLQRLRHPRTSRRKSSRRLVCGPRPTRWCRRCRALARRWNPILGWSGRSRATLARPTVPQHALPEEVAKIDRRRGRRPDRRRDRDRAHFGETTGASRSPARRDPRRDRRIGARARAGRRPGHEEVEEEIEPEPEDEQAITETDRLIAAAATDSPPTPLPSEVAASDASMDRVSEIPPEVDPDDMEIHEVPAKQTSAQRPGIVLPLPLPLHARADLGAAVQAQHSAEGAAAKKAPLLVGRAIRRRLPAHDGSLHRRSDQE